MSIKAFQKPVPKEWFSVDVQCQKAEVWFSEHSPSSLALQNSAVFPLKLAVPSRQRSPALPSPSNVGRICFTLLDVMFFVLQGDRPKWYQFSASLWLPWGSRDCQLVASPSWSQECIYGGRSQGVLCRLTRSVWWRTTCAHALVRTSSSLWCSHFSSPLLWPPKSAWQLYTVGTSRSCWERGKKKVSNSCCYRQGRNLSEFWQNSVFFKFKVEK